MYKRRIESCWLNKAIKGFVYAYASRYKQTHAFLSFPRAAKTSVSSPVPSHGQSVTETIIRHIFLQSPDDAVAVNSYIAMVMFWFMVSVRL